MEFGDELFRTEKRTMNPTDTPPTYGELVDMLDDALKDLKRANELAEQAAGQSERLSTLCNRLVETNTGLVDLVGNLTYALYGPKADAPTPPAVDVRTCPDCGYKIQAGE